MSAQNDGGAFHPVPTASQDATTGQVTVHQSEANWTVRDEFAARAMQGCAVHLYEEYSRADVAGDITRSIVAKAYAIADAMLAERAKVTP